MTEAEWLECPSPEPMLVFLTGKATKRQLRLYACALCRLLLWPALSDPRSRRAVEVAERFADGRVDAKDLAIARGAAWGAFEQPKEEKSLPRQVTEAMEAAMEAAADSAAEAAEAVSEAAAEASWQA